MKAVSVSISRTSDFGGPTPLVIAHNGSTYQITEDGIGRPGRKWRFEDMPNADGVHGVEHTSASLEESTLPLKALVKATTTAALEAALDALELALSQFSYEVTMTLDGVTRVWGASPADSQASLDSGEASAHISNVTISIPVYPVPS